MSWAVGMLKAPARGICGRQPSAITVTAATVLALCLVIFSSHIAQREH